MWVSSFMKQFGKLMKSNLLILLLILVQGCSSSPRYFTEKVSRPKKSKSVKFLKPKSSKDTKHNRKKKVMKGVSSFYAEDFHGKLTANGEVYDMYGVTAAHKTLPLGTVCRVTNLDNDKSLILRVNDRGPYVAGRILDCSYGAAKKLDFLRQGTTNVKIEVIEWGDGAYMHHRENKK